jgi:Ca-activated chloride channel family protein
MLAPGALVAAAGSLQAGYVFPLRSTAANADVSGWIASTRMIQTFTNPLDQPLEAVYVFPLPTTAGVSGFEMRVGQRRIVGVVRGREEAERTYADALKRGKTASLMSQERVNVFTQRVGNIAPATDVDVTVTYFHPLSYDHGQFEYVFPMTVGARYCPPSMDAADVARVSPPSGADAVRGGREVAVHVVLDAGAELGDVASPSHQIVVSREGRTRAVVDLARRDEVPNRDFILRFGVAADALRGGCVAHRAPDGTGYFTAFLVPPLESAGVDPGPRDVTFLVDASGSMDGAPFETLRGFVHKALDGLGGADRFDLIRFGGSIDAFEETSVPATRENVARAKEWIDACRVDGGTEMLPAVRKFAAMPADPGFRRFVGFLTDGFVGNESEILAAIRAERGDARWFAFGVGSSVNRAFIEGVAAEGRGQCDVVLPGEAGAADAAARRFFSRLSAPLLHDVNVDAGGLPVVDVSPGHPPDLFDGEPIFVVGRYTAPCEGDLVFRGVAGGRETTIACHVVLPEIAPAREELASMWARARIAEWTSTALGASVDVQSDCAAKITATALEHHLLAATTSFVCVDEDSFTSGDRVTVHVASEVPQDTR